MLRPTRGPAMMPMREPEKLQEWVARPSQRLRLVDPARLADERLDLADLTLAESEITRADDPVDLAAVAAAHDLAGDCRVAQRPGDCNLAGGEAVSFTDCSQGIGQGQVARKSRFTVLGVAAPPVVRWEVGDTFARHGAGEQARGHRRVDDHADVVFGRRSRSHPQRRG